MSLRELLLYGHIVGAILWIGGGVMFNVLAGRMRKAGNVDQIVGIVDDSVWLGKAYYTPIAIWVLVSGITLVLTSNGGYDFKDLFVIVGIAVVIGSGILGGAYYGKESEAIAAGARERGLGDPEVKSRLDRIRLISWLELAALFLVELLMVLRVGAY